MKPDADTMATGSGALIGVFLILIDLTPDDSGLVPLVANRTVNAGVMFAAIAGMAAFRWLSRSRSDRIKTEPRGWLPGLRLAIFCGILDAVANALLLLGLLLGELTVMSVLTAMYSAGTILLAAIVLQERLAKLQVVGLVLALVAAGMLALA